MSNDDKQFESAAVENEGSGRGGLSQAELDELVASSDTGGRNATGLTGQLILLVALAWSLFQLWIASPIPFILGFGVFNDTEARAFHLAFAMFLAFAAYPAQRTPVLLVLGLIVPILLSGLFWIGAGSDTPSWWIPLAGLAVIAAILLGSPKDRVPVWEWVLAIAGAITSLYIFFAYEGIATRVGAPITQDLVVGVIGMLLLLEATRRALGPALMIVATVFLAYTFLGPWMPGIIAHSAKSLSVVMNHQWITTEGVFGIALGVSTSFVFLFVLFGSLLDKAGAGNYFIQVAFSLMGHMRGGPAKAAVVSSAMTGLISGSSIANVVTTGTFTIPLMKRVGFNAEKAGAVEVASSVNGQIMPPVMGAAAFLMVEYVGIPYFDVVKHAFLPAVISYIALVYIVHLEAMKAGLKGLPRPYEPGPVVQRLLVFAFTIGVICALSFAVYFGMGWIKPTFGPAAGYVVFVLLTIVYIALLWVASKEPPLKMEDPNAPVSKLPMPGPTIRSGLYFLLPVVVLVWMLMIERKSPGLSAFWAAAFMIFILITQRPLMAILRGAGEFGTAVRAGFVDLLDGLVSGARNMIGIGIATATAGIIVGAVSQTGVGSALADVVEVLSGGNILAILFLTAILSLILGMGLPTTANYIVVSALLAPVIVTLGQQNGLIVPLIAVHLFVFYFGILADDTPPVGLAAFAAAAIARGDPIRTGLQGFAYDIRTAILPFLFIFNTQLLLIGIGNWLELISTIASAVVAMLLFAAATQGYWLVRSRLWESLALVLVSFTLFRPGFWWDMMFPPLVLESPTKIEQLAEQVPAEGELRFTAFGMNIDGDEVTRTVVLPMGAAGAGAQRLAEAGLEIRVEGEEAYIDNLVFGSPAEQAGLDFDWEILSVETEAERWPRQLMYLPALLVLGLIALAQRGRRGRSGTVAAAA